MSTEAELGQYICKHTIQKHSEDSIGVEPPNSPLGTPVCVNNELTRD